MERTELREAFFAEVRNDPYAKAVAHLVMDAWADGYEQALRDHMLDEARLRESHSDRVERAAERMTERRKEVYAETILAFAEIAKLLPRKSLCGRPRERDPRCPAGPGTCHALPLPPLDAEAVLWLAALECVPRAENRIAWVKTMLERVEQINATRAKL